MRVYERVLPHVTMLIQRSTTSIVIYYECLFVLVISLLNMPNEWFWWSCRHQGLRRKERLFQRFPSYLSDLGTSNIQAASFLCNTCLFFNFCMQLPCIGLCRSLMRFWLYQKCLGDEMLLHYPVCATILNIGLQKPLMEYTTTPLSLHLHH